MTTVGIWVTWIVKLREGLTGLKHQRLVCSKQGVSPVTLPNLEKSMELGATMASTNPTTFGPKNCAVPWRHPRDKNMSGFRPPYEASFFLFQHTSYVLFAVNRWWLKINTEKPKHMKNPFLHCQFFNQIYWWATMGLYPIGWLILYPKQVRYLTTNQKAAGMLKQPLLLASGGGLTLKWKIKMEHQKKEFEHRWYGDHHIYWNYLKPTLLFQFATETHYHQGVTSKHIFHWISGAIVFESILNPQRLAPQHTGFHLQAGGQGFPLTVLAIPGLWRWASPKKNWAIGHW